MKKYLKPILDVIYFFGFALLLCYYIEVKNQNTQYKKDLEIIVNNYKNLEQCNNLSLDFNLNFHHRFSAEYTKNDSIIVKKYFDSIIKLNKFHLHERK